MLERSNREIRRMRGDRVMDAIFMDQGLPYTAPR